MENFNNSNEKTYSNSRTYLNTQERDSIEINHTYNDSNIKPIPERKSYGVIKLPQNNSNKYVGDEDDEEDRNKSEEEEKEEEDEIEEEEGEEEEETSVIENDLSAIVMKNSIDHSKKINRSNQDSGKVAQKVDINKSIKTHSFNVEHSEEIQNDNILKIHCVEKQVTDEKTNTKKTLVKKKSIFYKDGTSQSVVFSKNK